MFVLLCVFLFFLAKNGEGKPDYNDYDTVGRVNSGKPGSYPLPYDEPVPFGHITREGFGDPFSPLRPPFDGFERTMRFPKDREEALELLRKSKGSQLFFLDPKIPKQYSQPSAKEEMLLERYMNIQPEPANETRLKWYDLVTIQGRNAQKPSKEQYIARKKPPMQLSNERPHPPPGVRAGFFPKNSFNLGMEIEEPVLNWTTCDQFAVGAVFAPKDVINTRWTPFYIWDTQGMFVSTEHTFEIPSNKLVNEYHFKYSKMVNKSIDWSKAKLLMKGIVEALLIAADKRGLFHAVVKHELPDSAAALNLKLPSMSLRIKVEDPYLVMMFCEQHFGTVMAVSGNEPTDAKEMEVEAASVKFRGTGRPVWRNFEMEREKVIAAKEKKIREEAEKTLVIDEVIPPIGQWD